MRNKLIIVMASLGVLLTTALPLLAHHSFAAEFDASQTVTLEGKVVKLEMVNPHSWLHFDVTKPDGTVEHWDSELLTNPSALARAGWTKSRSVDALKPGTRVKLYIGTSRVGGFSGIVMKIENEKGENVVGERGNATGVDLDGVAGGLQPSADKKE